MTVVEARGDLLATIVAATRRSLEWRRAQRSEADLESMAAERVPNGAAFARALARPDRFNVIAECKRRSPSRGVLRASYDPVALALEYAAAGAAAISILTEPTFFDGALAHLAAVRDVVRLPLLRKDFIVDRYQVLEARAHGADAVLLIVAALDPRQLESLMRQAERLELAALVEVHDDAELVTAVEAGATLIGVNNRSLRTLAVDVETSERVIARMPPEVIAVAESGLRTQADLVRLRGLGYRAFLVGEQLVTSAEAGRALAELLR
jgi:indole-3-glycerol phosphate synthase